MNGINGNNDVLRIKVCILNVDGHSMKYALHSSSLIRCNGQCDSLKYFHQACLNCFYVNLYVETYKDLHDNNV